LAMSYKENDNESGSESDDALEARRRDEIMHAKNSVHHSSGHEGTPHEDYDLIIIGAGPSGLFCAINSIRKDTIWKDATWKDKIQNGITQKERKILVLEKKETPGHKLLISGSGHCNITHDGDIRDFLNHFGDNGRFLRPALLGFTNHDLVSYFEGKGLAMIRENGGKIFPETLRARDVLNILIEGCGEKEVGIDCGQEVRSIAKTESGFRITCERCDYSSRMLVIATGGCSYPGTGSTGDGYRFARDLGHSIVEIGPALTPLIIKDYPFSELAGISFSDMGISLYRQGKIGKMQGDILFTHQGLSGPAVLDLSRRVRPGDILKLSFVPVEERGALDEWLLDRAGSDGALTLKTVMADLPHSVPLPPRLIKRILEISGIDADSTLAHLTRGRRTQLIDNLTGLPLAVSELVGFNMAMVTRGGVSLKEVNPKTMESRRVSGLYLVGEVLDIDGDSGGYNLQAAFSTGMLAAKSIMSRLG
jgi:predicted Rossmann fold flavoprotein